MSKVEDVSMDDICDSIANISFAPVINVKLVNDLNTIITEILSKGTYDVDIYDICVDCGHSLTWDQEYNINESDLLWLKAGGMRYFFEHLHNFMPIETVETYNKVCILFNKLIELFSLQVLED